MVVEWICLGGCWMSYCQNSKVVMFLGGSEIKVGWEVTGQMECIAAVSEAEWCTSQ